MRSMHLLKKAFAASASLARFRPLSSLISMIHPAVTASTFSLSLLANENESLNQALPMILKNVLLPMALGAW